MDREQKSVKKICICTTVAGTMESFVLDTAKYLHSQCGYDVSLICSPDDAFTAQLPKYIHFLSVHMARGIDFSAVSSILQFYQIFRRERFDMVQYSTPNASCYASIAAKLAGVPIRLYCQWGIRYVGLNGASRRIFKLIEKMICANSTDIRAVSPMNRAFAVAEGLYSEDKAFVIGKGGTIGVDMSVFDIQRKAEWRKDVRAKLGIDEEAFVYGFCGRISADKGCTELLSAFRELAACNSNARLIIIGYMDYNCGIKRDLLDWAKESSSIVFTGKIPQDQMKYYYAGMDVLVHPTYREGFGMVLQEAGALGIAMITTKIPGASEVMEDGVSCVLVEPKNTADLEAAMKKLIEDRTYTQNIGQGAFERTKTYYDRPIMLENQRADYEKILG